MFLNIIVTDFEHHCMLDVIVTCFVINFDSLHDYVRLTIRLFLIVKTSYSTTCFILIVIYIFDNLLKIVNNPYHCMLDVIVKR